MSKRKDKAKRLAVNPDPLKPVPVLRCKVCRNRAPWCSCGRMEYVEEAKLNDR